MVAEKHSGPQPQRILAVAGTGSLHAAAHSERYACSPPHGPFECPSDSPLAEAAIAYQPQGYASHDAVDCTYHQKEEAGNAEGVKWCQLRQPAGQHERQGAEDHDERRR